MSSGSNADISEESVNELEYKPEDIIIFSAQRKKKMKIQERKKEMRRVQWKIQYISDYRVRERDYEYEY